MARKHDLDAMDLADDVVSIRYLLVNSRPAL